MHSPVSFLLGHPKGPALGTGLRGDEPADPGVVAPSWAHSALWCLEAKRPRQASPAGLLPSVTLGRSLRLPAAFFSS